MIITIDQLRSIKAYERESVHMCLEKIKQIESVIRTYTNNNFQNRMVQFYAKSDSDLLSLCPYLKVDDSVEISQSINKGVYTIVDVKEGRIMLDVDLYPCAKNLVTKVEYPLAVQAGVLSMIEWETTNKKKVGIKSETISRHSVTYYDQDTNNTVMGYPVSLMAFCEPYMKPRY